MINRSAMSNRATGFTLIETMVVVVIIAILAGIALPAYQDSIVKGRRADAKAALLDVANRQEQHMLDHSIYADDVTNLGYADDPMDSSEGYYEVSSTKCASPLDDFELCYVLTASASADSPQADDTLCGNLTLRSDGEKGNSGTLPFDECW